MVPVATAANGAKTRGMKDIYASRDIVKIEAMTHADELRNETVAYSNMQRGKATTSRSKTPGWTTLMWISEV